MIVPARTSGADGDPDGITLFLVEKGAPGLTIERQTRVDHRNAALVQLDGVVVASGIDRGRRRRGRARCSKP